MTTPTRIGAACVTGISLTLLALMLQGQSGALSLSVVFGALFGFVLQRSRFCFFCIFRDWLDRRDPRGLLGLLTALAVGIAGYTVVYGAWLPDPATGRLPPDAFIGPVSPALVAAGLAFGAGMAVSGSCVSAHLYRLGEGSATAPFALVGTALGFVIGFLTWNPLYLAVISDAPIVWLPFWLGYPGALAAGMFVLGCLSIVLLRSPAPDPRPGAQAPVGPWHAVFVARWPAWAGGLAIGAIATASYFRVGPLGVTAEIGARSRQAAAGFGLLPSRLEGLDTLRGCVAVVRDVLLTPNGTFIAALVAGSFAASLASGEFGPTLPTAGRALRGMLGGTLLGWGAMTGLGCTVGTLLSGIMAGAASGWVFAIAVFAGAAWTLRLGRYAGLLRPP